MVNKIGVDNNNSGINSIIVRKHTEGNPNFKGLGSLALAGIQKCEQIPMINVAVIDMLSAILPRTAVESMTNWFAGFEAFRRESSGLFVNCIIPGFVTLGIAKLLNPALMPGGANMSRCWADKELINKFTEYYNNASSTNKIEESLRNIIKGIEGYEGNELVKFDKLGDEKINKYAQKLYEISQKDISNAKMRKEVEEISKDIIENTNVAEHIKVGGADANSVHSLMEDSVKFFREYSRVSDGLSIEEFAKKSKRLVNTKSLIGLSIILPLAMSMQYINRWITGKMSGTKGAPIYEDFAKGKENIEESPKAKEGLLTQKFISIASMIGVSLLSMMKMPSMKMLEFKGNFPTMDQARIISTATFSSRMSAADDKNELVEATIRDIATFSSLYFLGDYASKAAATFVQNKTGIRLLNDTKPIDKDASKLKKFWHWVKDVNVKSSEEVISKTKEMLNGATPTEEQAKAIEKELKKAKNLRATCQATNIGVSLVLLGLVIPIFTRKHTKKKHEEALKLAEQNDISSKDTTKEQAVTPLNIKYSNLTASFKAEEK